MSDDKIINTDNLSLDNSNPIEERVIQNADINSADYIAISQICSTLDTKAPVQLLYEMNRTMSEIDRKVNGVDAYVMNKLGYNNLIELCEAFSAEQVDAIAVAIYNIEEKGQAVIVGDMTGVGKGRIAGGVMRYARLNNKKPPIFFTEKPNLFSDLYRDLIDIQADNGIVQDYLQKEEREKQVKVTIKEIRERIESDIDNGDFDMGYDADKLFKKGYEKQTNDCIEEYRELYFPTTTRMIPVYKRNADYEKEFKYSDRKFVPFILNNRGDKTNIKDANGNIIYKALDSETKKKVYEDKELPKGFDCILLTYSQIRNPNRGKDKADFIKAMAVGNIIIMDESHNASGSSNTGVYLQGVLAESKGATFLSATFAKRPDNMPIYAMKTAIADAELSNKDLVEAISRGGVALQEILSADLVGEGQMVRRERSYEGIDVNYVYLDESLSDPENPFVNPEFDLKEQHRAISDEITRIIRKILNFQAEYVNPVIERMDEKFAEEQESADVSKQNQQAGINNPPVFNGIFNLISQLLLSIKADALADWAIMRMQQGKKPVIALANTMESFLDYIVEAEGETTIKTDFSMVLKRRLLSTLRYTKRYPDGTNEKEVLNPDEMSAPFRDEYYTILTEIEQATIGINISPLDVIISKIEKAGFSIAEVTGRNKYMEFISKGRGIIKNRVRQNNTDLFRKFNNNEIDCLLINQSGATGASAHSFKTDKVKTVYYNEAGKPIIPVSLDDRSEVKQRVMIVVQAELNVNTEVQKRGRVNRTGQVFPPIYDYIISSIPAEKRLMMMLQKKLKSLDANTTSNQKQSSKIIDIVDFLNVYGDAVIIDYMKDNPAINEITGNVLRFDHNEPTDETYTVEDRAHRVSGRIAILSSEMQEDFYTQMINNYEAYLQKKKDAGEDNLQVERIDLKAKTIKTDVVEPPNTEGRRSVFSEGVYLETCECQNLRKPYEQKDVEAMIDNALILTDDKGKETILSPEQMMNYHLDRFRKHSDDRYKEDMADAEFMYQRDLKSMRESKAYERLETEQDQKNYVREKTIQIDENHKIRVDKINTSTEAIKRNVEGQIRFFYAKRKIDYPLQGFETEGNRADGICLGVKIDYKGKGNPFAPSNIAVKIVMTNQLRLITLKLSDVFLAKIKDATNTYSGFDMNRSIGQSDMLLEDWNSKTKESRANKVTKFIVTGNILKALGDADFREGTKLINFTTHDGKSRKGVLLPDIFKPKTYDVTLGILKALPIIMNMASGQAHYVKGSGISFVKAGNYWKIQANSRGSEGIYKDLKVAEFAVYDKWEQRSGVWTLNFEKPRMEEMITYLNDKYKFKIGISGNVFDAWKEKLGFTQAIEQDIKDSQTDGSQEIIEKYNEEYNKYEQEKQDAERVVEIAEEVPEEFEGIKAERDANEMKLKMVRIYFKIKNHLKAQKVEKYNKGGTIGNLTLPEKKKLRYLLAKYKINNATKKDMMDLTDLVEHVKPQLHFTEWGEKQMAYYTKKHDLRNAKEHDYNTIGDIMLSEFEATLFKHKN